VAQRYYISKVVGTGTFSDKFRSKAQDLLANVAGVDVHVKIKDGAVAGDWCLVNVSAADHAVLLADADHVAFPQITLDAQLNTVSAGVRNAILTACQNRGIDTSGVTGATAFRVLVRRAGRALSAVFDENTFG
jgi:hypothetical protein